MASISFFIFILFSISFVSSQIDGTFLDCFLHHSPNSTSISKVVFTPKSPSFATLLSSEARNQRFAKADTPKPQVILTPTEPSEIQLAIYCARRHGWQIRALSGGHDYEGLSYVSEQHSSYVVVDLINFRSATIDVESNTAWVQAGSTLGELYYKIANESRTLAFSAGVWPTLGLGGHLSGGGYGMLSRKYGLAIDNIVDAVIIDVNGRILNREAMGEDLFWAIRGGGAASFGVVLSWKIKLVPVLEKVTVFNVNRTLEENATMLIRRWQQISSKIDEDLTIRVFIDLVNSTTNDGNTTILASFPSLYLGGVDKLLHLMRKVFPELGLSREDCSETSWIESVLYFVGLNGQPLDILLNRTSLPGFIFKGKSDFVTHPIPDSGLELIYKMLGEEPVGLTRIFFSSYGGKMNEIAETETPFPNRNGTLFNIQYFVAWAKNDVREETKHLTWIRRFYDKMEPYVTKSPRLAYFNYRDLDLGVNEIDRNTTYAQASVWGNKYFGNNFDRLVRVKKAIDPSNFFRNEQSIPPAECSYSRRCRRFGKLSTKEIK